MNLILPGQNDAWSPLYGAFNQIVRWFAEFGLNVRVDHCVLQLRHVVEPRASNNTNLKNKMSGNFNLCHWKEYSIYYLQCCRHG